MNAELGGRPARRLFSLGLGLAVAVILLDQLTKWYVVAVLMAPPRVIEVTGFFNLALVWNRGVSFGMLGGDGGAGWWLLSLVAVAIVGGLLFWLWRADRPILAVALGLVIGGAIGNVIDRLRLGAVADFLDFHLGGYHWPAFNLADSAITVGVVALVVPTLFGGRKTPK
ncbi:MAG: signal peptidase II [Candidatus Eiseniibacteriota bacterium]